MKRIKLILCLLLSLSLHISAQTVIYPMAPGLRASPLYKVTLIDSGQAWTPPVYTDEARWKTNRCQTTSWSNFATSHSLKVRVTSLIQKIDTCHILPRRHQIKCRIVNDSVAEFTLPGPGHYSVEFEQGVAITHPLLLFADSYPLRQPSRETPELITFEAGIHHIGDNFRLKSNQTVFLKPGAYLKGQFTAENAENITIMGQGILSGEEYPARSHNHMISMKDCNNILIEGITIINAPRYCVSLNGTNQICRNLKMMGWWFSTDGIGIGSNGLIEDCFFKVNDDAIKLYRSNTIARRCVIWQMENGAPLQIGWNMPGYNSNFHVYDIDIIRVEHPWDNPNEAVFDAIHGSEGTMTQYVYENIRIDNCEHRLFHLMTRPNRFGKWNPQKGEVSNLIFRDIECYTQPRLKNIIMGHDTLHPVKNILLENIKVNGKVWASPADANLITNPKTTPGITVKSSLTKGKTAPTDNRNK
ncbi:glycosyl hydrolase family 28 protein [uncultured Bacteroides sp.]|uniref:glycosyl hydrolase family 28 protein n=1 Tax=uncultured Bacteroides sp. TaxID=162156 RepID=UPI00258FC3F5|nr:glycosyl hydrolase family 28 protein [uncultured Bacteroides sp.]